MIAEAVRAEEAAREAANLRGRVQNLRQRLAGSGRGTEFPPCWADPATGRIESICDVAPSAEGSVVRERDPPQRAADRRALPLAGVVLGRRIGAAAFLARFEPLYAWSVRHECRVFVRAPDETGPTEKAIYKRRMRVPEGRCYKYEVPDGGS